MYEADSAAKVAGICELIEDYGLEPSELLDVGCGSGTVLAGVSGRLGVPGVGIDPDAAMLGTAGDFPGVTLVRGDVFSTELTADLVLCIDVFEHVDDDLAFLEALKARGNWFVFRIPLDESVWDRLRGRTERFRTEYGHLHAYTWGSATRRLREAGYDVRAVRAHRIPAGGPMARGIRKVAGAVSVRAASRVIGGWSLLVLARELR